MPGMVNPATVKYVAWTDCEEIVTEVVPMFFTFTANVLLAPTGIEPKFALAGLNERVLAAVSWLGMVPEKPNEKRKKAASAKCLRLECRFLG